LDGGALSVGDVQPAQARRRLVERGEFGVDLVAKLDNERARGSSVEHLVVFGSVWFEVGGQIVFGVASLVGDNHPNLLAAQPLA